MKKATFTRSFKALMFTLLVFSQSNLQADCPSSCNGDVSATFNGVAARKNCPIGSDCAFGYNWETGINTGYKWQCVEYVNRYYKIVYFMDLKSTGIYGDAEDYWLWDGHASIGLTKYPNGGSTAPAIGDMIVSTYGVRGHIAIIVSVTATTVVIIDQNFSSNSQRTLTRSGNTVSGFNSQYTIAGWIRKTSSGSCPAPTLSQISASNITISAAKLNCSLSGVSLYVWRIRVKGTSTWTYLTATSVNYKNISGLTNGTIYDYQVAVTCEETCSPWSPTRSFVTAPSTSKLFASNVTTTSAKLNCTVSGVTYYDWQYRRVGISSWTDVTQTSVNYKTITGLTPNTSYEFRAALSINSTYSNWSGTKSFQTLSGNISYLTDSDSAGNSEQGVVIVSPNPTSDFIRVHNADRFKSINVLDSSGRIVDVCINYESGLIDLSGNPGGTYFVFTRDHEGKVSGALIVLTSE